MPQLTISSRTVGWGSSKASPLLRTLSMLMRGSVLPRSALVSRQVRDSACCCRGTDKKRPASRYPSKRVIYSGNVLLSQSLSPYYHWRCIVSLPCSGWERVGPMRYGHQGLDFQDCCRSSDCALSLTGCCFLKFRGLGALAWLVDR